MQREIMRRYSPLSHFHTFTYIQYFKQMSQKRKISLLRLDLINVPQNGREDEESHSVKSSARRSETPQLSARSGLDDLYTPREDYLSPRRHEEASLPVIDNIPSLDAEEEELIDALVKLDRNQWLTPPHTARTPENEAKPQISDVFKKEEAEVVENESAKEKPKEPFFVAYQCSCCQQRYSDIVTENPWYHMVRHECPICHREQYPFLDIHLAINARELDPNTSFYYENLHDEEFLDLETVSETDDFSMTLTEPILDLLFSVDHRPVSNIVAGLEAEGKSLADLVDLRLLALITHAVRCQNVHHSAVKQTNLCHNTKVLLLHMSTCHQEKCIFPCCTSARPVLKYLSSFPSENEKLLHSEELITIKPEQKIVH